METLSGTTVSSAAGEASISGFLSAVTADAGFVNPRVKQSKRKHWDGRVNSIECRLAPLAIQVFACTKVPSKAGRKKKES